MKKGFLFCSDLGLKNCNEQNKYDTYVFLRQTVGLCYFKRKTLQNSKLGITPTYNFIVLRVV